MPPTLACTAAAAAAQGLPTSLLLAILHEEAGWTGAAIRNQNGSIDLGVAQINLRQWGPILSAYGISAAELQWDGCLNVAVGAWILAYEIARAPDLWVGVGRYHSPDPVRASDYAARVARVWPKYREVLNEQPPA